MSSKARKIHAQAEMARELKQDLLKSLQLIDQAIIAYQKEGDLRGLSEAIQSRASAFKHLYQQTNDATFLILAKHSSLAGVEIAKKLKNKSALVMPYRGLAKIYEQLQDFKNASLYFKKAVKAFQSSPPPEHNRPAVLADMKAHLHSSEYLAGDKSAYPRLLRAIKDLDIANELRYNKDVWLSGAHLRAALMLHKDNPTKAQEHFYLARKIINANPELVLRKAQLEKLKKRLT